MNKNSLKNPDEILSAEFTYIANTAFQANEDRARVASYYIVSVGSIVASIFGTQLGGNTKGISLAFTILFIVLTILGALTIAQLARLRSAWRESAEAMCQLKNHYIKTFPDIQPAFKWLSEGLPAKNKPNSIANLMAEQVAVLSSLTFGAAIYFLLTSLVITNWVSWLATIMAFGTGYWSHKSLYNHLLE